MSRHSRVLLIVSVAAFVASLDLFIVNIAFPDIQHDFADTSDAALSWVLNGYAIVFAALLVPAGRLADLIGRKRVFMFGLLLFVLASALCAAATSVQLLVAARVLQAVGGAALLPTSLALLLPEFTPEKRPAAIAIWSASGAIAAAAGPPIGGLLVQGSWRWVFLVNLPVGLVTAFFAARILRETPGRDGERLPDLGGALVLIAAIAALTLGIVKGPDWGWGSPTTIGVLAGALIGLGVFAWRCAHHEAPVIEQGLLRVRAFAWANIAGLFFFAAFGAMLLSSVLFLTRVWHEDVLTAGLQIAPGPATAALLALPAGLLAARFGQRALVLPGLIVYAGGAVWWLTHMGLQVNFAGDYLPGMIIGGAGVGMVIPTLASATAAALPSDRFATGSAVYGMARQIGVALGVAILIALLGHPAPTQVLSSFQHGWGLMLGATLLAFAAAVAIGRVPSFSGAAEPVPTPAPA